MAALDDVPEMRAVLGLFEGVVTGAADGYGRMTGRPAATLLHLGPGLGNGIANLHNARMARTPVAKRGRRPCDHPRRVRPPAHLGHRELGPAGVAVVPLVGDPRRPRYGRRRRRRGCLRTARRRGHAGRRRDASWREAGEPASGHPGAVLDPVADDAVAEAAKALRSGEPAVLLVEGNALRRRGLAAADRVARAAGAKLLCETFPARIERGAGIPPSSGSAIWPSSPSPSSKGPGTWCWPTPSPRCRSSPTPTCPAPWCPRGARCTPSPPGPTTRPGRWKRWRRCSGHL